MPVQYEQLRSPRFRIRTIDGRDAIEIAPQRLTLITGFLIVWLVIWTFAGLNVLGSLTHKPLNAFLAAWSCLWALAWGYAVFLLSWRLAGVQVLTVRSSDLEITYRLFGFPIRRIYQGREIRHLSANDATVFSYGSRFNGGVQSLPFMRSNKIGCIKFGYGARTVYAGDALDEEEGRQIAAWLLKRLPSTAGEPAA